MFPIQGLLFKRAIKKKKTTPRETQMGLLDVLYSMKYRLETDKRDSGGFFIKKGQFINLNNSAMDRVPYNCN